MSSKFRHLWTEEMKILFLTELHFPLQYLSFKLVQRVTTAAVGLLSFFSDPSLFLVSTKKRSWDFSQMKMIDSKLCKQRNRHCLHDKGINCCFWHKHLLLPPLEPSSSSPSMTQFMVAHLLSFFFAFVFFDSSLGNKWIESFFLSCSIKCVEFARKYSDLNASFNSFF